MILSRISPTARTVVIYVLAAGAWIFFSDWALEQIISDASTLTRVQSYKGFGFVFVTSGLLFFLLSRQEKTLHRVETRFHRVVESAPNAMIMVNREGNIVLLNAQVEKLFGYSRQELLGHSVEALVPLQFRGKHPGYRGDFARQPSARLMGAGRDLFGLRKDGTEIPVEIGLNPVKTEEGHFVIASIVDISERKRMETDLLASNRALESMFQASPLAVVTLTREGNVRVWNPAAEMLLGWTHDEAVGQPYPAVPENKKEEFRGILTRALEGKPTLALETTRRRKDGSLLEVSSSMAPLFGPGKRVDGVILMIADISERKRAEREREQVLHELDTVIRHIPVGVIFAEAPSGKLLFANDQVERVLGRSMPSADTVDQYSADTGFHLDGRPYKPDEWPLARAIRDGEIVRDEEVNYLRGDGKRSILSISAAPVLDGAKRIVGGVVILRDVTDQKQAVKERENLEHQFRQVQKMEAIGALAGSIAHDFNNMLMAIGGYADLAMTQIPEGSQARNDIKDLQKTVHRAATLTQQILTFSRGKVMKSEPVRLNTVLEEMKDMLKRLLGSSVELRMRLNGKTDLVMADTSQIQQVVMNFAVNARDAMPRQGRLSIETKDVEIDEEYIKEHYGIEQGCYVQLSVSDTGIGIPKEIQDRIFEPFFTTKEAGKGTGLGLSTSYGIVRQHGGHILVYSEMGKGSTFKIYLPALQENEEGVRYTEKKRITGPFLRGTEAILLVEDEEGVRDIMERTLRGLGYMVVSASSGDEAVKLLPGCPVEVDLLITDVVMPGMDVQDMVRHVKDLFPRVKVLFISGYADDARELQGVLQTGAYFMQKPFSPKDISFKVRAIFEGTA